MNWKEALNEIESLEFDVQLSVVSSFSLFMKAARKEPAVASLYQAMQSATNVSDKVLRRVGELSSLEIDTRYENPMDTALAVSLWILSLVQPAQAKDAALKVTSAPNCHYAWKVARSVLMRASLQVSSGDMMTGQSGNEGGVNLNGSGGWVFRSVPASNDAGEVFVEHFESMATAGSSGATQEG